MSRKRKEMATSEHNGASGSEQPEDQEVWTHGEYMQIKRVKLQDQFKGAVEAKSNLFNGITININGLVQPTNLRYIFAQHGGTYDMSARPTTDYVIASNLANATKKNWGKVTLKPDWVLDSIAAGKVLNPKLYLLYDCNQENKQRTMSQALRSSVSNKAEATGAAKTGMEKDVFRDSFENQVTEFGVDSAIPSSENIEATSPLRKAAWEEGFLEEFWAHSRLHYISTMKRSLQTRVAKLRRDKVQRFPELEAYKEYLIHELGQRDLSYTSGRVLFLVDLDCFFVSVGRLSRPEMIGKPVVVTHSKGKGSIPSNSDIACASYEARSFGIRNGMIVAEARTMCPNVHVIPYDFEAYQRISTLFCDTICGFTLEIEPGSCDELLVDVTSILQDIPSASPETLAEFMRRRIFDETQCNASVGIGENRLLAKLASKQAKPNGVSSVLGQNVANLISAQSVRDLYGVGWSICEKLNEKNVHTCKELQALSMVELQKEFGVKRGETLFKACRGIDNQSLNYEFEKPKSISVDVNYGVRLTEEIHLEKFVTNICRALSRRAEEANALATKLQITVLARQENAPEPTKLGGHGHVNQINKTTNFMNPTRSFEVIAKSALNLIKALKLPPVDYRGLGIHLTGLKFDSSGKKQQTLQVLMKPKTSAQQVSHVNQDASSAITETEPISSGEVSSEPGHPGLSESFLDALPGTMRDEVIQQFQQIRDITTASTTKLPHNTVSDKEKNKTSEQSEEKLPSERSSNLDRATNRSSDNIEGYILARSIFRSVKPRFSKDRKRVYDKINWWSYSSKDDVPTMTNSKGYILQQSTKRRFEVVQTPTLKRSTEMHNVRAQIRNMMSETTKPTKEALMQLSRYVEDLFVHKFYENLRNVLSFLERLSKTVATDSRWQKIFTGIIDALQAKFKERHGFVLQLKNDNLMREYW